MADETGIDVQNIPPVPEVAEAPVSLVTAAEEIATEKGFGDLARSALKEYQSLRGEGAGLLLAGGFAFNVALAQTVKELHSGGPGESFKKITEGLHDGKQFLDEEFVKSKASMVVNDKGETLENVFSRNFEEFLNELRNKVVSKS